MRRCSSCDRTDGKTCSGCGNGACPDHLPVDPKIAVRVRTILVPVWVPPGPHPEPRPHPQPYDVITWQSGGESVDFSISSIIDNAPLTAGESSSWTRSWTTGATRCVRCRTREANEVALSLVRQRLAAAEAKAKHDELDRQREANAHEAKVVAHEALSGGHEALVRRRNGLASLPHTPSSVSAAGGYLFVTLLVMLFLVPEISAHLVHPAGVRSAEYEVWAISAALTVGPWFIWLVARLMINETRNARGRQLQELQSCFGCGEAGCQRCK